MALDVSVQHVSFDLVSRPKNLVLLIENHMRVSACLSWLLAVY